MNLKRTKEYNKWAFIYFLSLIFTMIVRGSHQQNLIWRVLIKIVFFTYELSLIDEWYWLWSLIIWFCLQSINSPTQLNVFPVNCDVIIAIVSTLFVPKASSVHQFMLNGACVDAPIIYRDCLASALTSNEAVTPLFNLQL
jgi:hypothetical protein